jgi:hypothetical protein
MISQKKDSSGSDRGGASVRLASYAVLGVLATVFASSVMPPIFTSSTNRALIDAPLVPMTTPIGGIVKISDQAGKATVENDKVDNSTLIGLKVQLAALDNDLLQKNSIVADYSRRIDDLRADLSNQQAALLSRTDAELKASQAAYQIVDYSTRIAKDNAARKLKMMSQGIAAGSANEVADTIHLEDSKLQAAKLAVDKLNDEITSARAGVYIGADLQSLQDLQREIRTRTADLLQTKLQISTIQARRSELQALVSAEGARIDRLAHADLSIPPDTRLYKPVAATGREVVAGDTLAEAIDCRDAFVVAIFSERQAEALSVGSKVSVSAEGWSKDADGTVARLIPRTTDRVDLDYAVPFPPTERRELYAYIKLDQEGLADLTNNSDCSVGTWVAVSMPNDWLEKSGAYTRDASTSFGTTLWASANNLPAVVDAAWRPIAATRDMLLQHLGYESVQKAPEPETTKTAAGRQARHPNDAKATEAVDASASIRRVRS